MYIVFDIGGTKMRVGVSRDKVTVDKTVTIETPGSYEAGLAEIKKAGEALAEGNTVLGVAGGIAGPFSHKKASLVNAPNLKGWIGQPLQSELENFFRSPVFIENDAALAGLGEAIRGGGRGFDIVAYITVSTGIGGSKIVKKDIDHHSLGFEPGHQIIDLDQTLIPDADGVTIEDYISGKSIYKRTGMKPKDITDADFWDGCSRVLAYGLNNVCVFWSPDVIVLGGSMITGSPAIPLDKAALHLKEIMHIYPEIPKIKKAELGDIGGLHGALELLKKKMN